MLHAASTLGSSITFVERRADYQCCTDVWWLILDAILVDNDARFVFGFVRQAINNGALLPIISKVVARNEPRVVSGTSTVWIRLPSRALR